MLRERGRDRDRETETDRQTDRQRQRHTEREDKFILLSGLRPTTTGVNIQTISNLMEPLIVLNFVF